MARYCIVAPLQILEPMHEVGQLGNWHLVLAHDVVKHPKRYANIFQTQSNLNRFVILDNSVVELGRAVDHAMIFEAAEIVKPTCVVLPDVPLEGEQTRRAHLKCLELGYLQRNKLGIMALPQGKTLTEFARCAEAFCDIEGIEFWGVPRNLVKQLGSREKAIHLLHSLKKRRIIHMFGFSDDLIDDVMCANDPRVYSIDSAVPPRCPGRLSITAKMPPRGDWWDTAVYNEEVKMNIELARRWFFQRQ